MDVSLGLACPVRFENDPAANPYLAGFAWSLLALVAVFRVWQHMRPVRRAPLRWFAGAGSGLVALVTVPVMCGALSDVEREASCRFVFEGSLFVSACLVVEILLSFRRPELVARALARVRRVRKTSSRASQSRT